MAWRCWVERCALGTGVQDVAWDEASGCVVQRRDGAVLGAWLVVHGHLDRAAGCVFRPLALRPLAPGMAVHALVPAVTAASAAPDVSTHAATDQVPDSPFGAWGAGTHGIRHALTHADWPDLAVLVDEGQERPMFDPATLLRLR